MQYTFHDLHTMTVAQLREIAAGVEHDAVHGYTTMHKEPLVQALCEAFGIEAHEHHEIVGVDKARIKKTIRTLKAERDRAQAAGDPGRTKEIRREIHRLKHRLRRARV